MINTSSTLSPDLFGDGDLFTIDFWYKPLAVINACSVGHEWYNGSFYFGIANDNGLCLYFASYRGSYGVNAGSVNVGKWYHVAIVRSLSNRLLCFIDGIFLGHLPYPTYSLRLYNIG